MEKRGISNHVLEQYPDAKPVQKAKYVEIWADNGSKYLGKGKNNRCAWKSAYSNTIQINNTMKNQTDYNKYECPYSHLPKEFPHELHGPEGYQDAYSVWCPCGFRAPVFYLDPKDLNLKLKDKV